MGVYLSVFKFDSAPPSEEEFRFRLSGFYSTSCIESIEVDERELRVCTMLGPFGVHYVHAVAKSFGGRINTSGADYLNPPEFTLKPFAQLGMIERWRHRLIYWRGMLR